MRTVTKNQHYVPQSYLKCFSPDNSSIGTLCIEEGRCIEKAPIKGQAKKEWFYDRNNEIENSFSEVEGVFLQNRQSIAQNPQNKLTCYQWEVMYQDMIIQLMRTLNMANIVNSKAKTRTDLIWKHNNNPLIRELADITTVKIPNAIIHAMHTFCQHPYILLDLKWKLLINNTERPFITSDNPVSLYNQFLEKRNSNLCGLAAAGLQAFYPLMPQLGVLYYDGEIYKCGVSKRHFVEINRSDVFHLNRLSSLNATNSVYYNPELVNSIYVKDVVSSIKNYRINRFHETEIPITPNSSYLITKQLIPLCKIHLSFIKELDKAKLRRTLSLRKNVIMGNEW